MRKRVGAAAIVTLGLVASGCASVADPLAGLTTKRAVGESLSNLLDQPGVQARLSLGVTGAQLAQLADSGRPAGTPLAPGMKAELDGVAATSVVVDLHTTNGQNLSQVLGHTTNGTSSPVASDIAVRVGSNTPVELRSVHSTLYARVDLSEALTDYGQDPAKAASVEGALTRANQELPGIGALGQGRWVSADLSSLAKLEQHRAGTANPTAARDLETAFTSALSNNATFTNSGTHDGRTEYTISVAARGFVTSFVAGASKAFALSASEDAKVMSSLTARIPASKRVTVQEYVKGDKAEELDVNLAQFDPARIPFAFPVRVVLSSGTDVGAPSGATAVDVSRLTSLLSSLSGLTTQSHSVSSGTQLLPPAAVPTSTIP